MAEFLENRHISNLINMSCKVMNNLISQLGIIIGGYIYDRGKCGSGKIWRNCPKPATLYRS